MIRSIIQAGFGNQLFQYATAYALARELKQELELDISWFEAINKNAKYTFRKNQLNKLCLDFSKCIEDRKFSSYRLHSKFSFLKRISVNEKKIPFICENMKLCRSDQSALFQGIGQEGAVLYGFWQNLKYFDKYLNDLRRQFVPNYPLAQETKDFSSLIKSTNSVGVHIRRGDFVRLGWDKGTDYYDKGLSWFKTQIVDCKFFIFSDDVQWVKNQYGMRSDVVVIDLQTKNKDVDEFFLLSSCSHQFISESTFGWWAAYLNSNPKKIVLYPKEAKGNIFDLGWVKL